MAQGYANPASIPRQIELADSANIDAFGRLRVSSTSTIWNSQLTYNLQPLVYDQITTGGGATISFDSTNRDALLSFAGTLTGGEVTMQSFEHIRYAPGRSQLVFVSFNFVEHLADVVKYVGYSDGTNGIEFQSDGSGFQWVLLSGTGSGNQTVAQASWNLDPLDGTGNSGITLDVSKIQIAVIDFQALYSGRVRVGFDIDGQIFYCHEFLASNLLTTPYIASANLPIRAGMTNTATVTTTMNLICASVSAEGDTDGSAVGEFSVNNNVTAGNGTRTYMMSVRPKTTFNSITNRIKITIPEINVLITGSSPVFWELCLGQQITTPTYADVNATYSASEWDTAGSLSGSPAIVFASGYVAASSPAKGAINSDVASKFPITLDASGAQRDLGTVTLLVTGIGGTSATQASLTIREEK